jgi:farnesyl diphosphate synthase
VSVSVFESWQRAQLLAVEQRLTTALSAQEPQALMSAMRHAVLDGGKRLRPLLVLATAQALATRQPTVPTWMPNAALRAACAVELIHAYSLVHDDMPCMDNDVLRRGKPTVHVAFGEATALLAGDALQTLAFEVLTALDDDTPSNVVAHCVRLLAQASGASGMAGGQAIDLASVGLQLSAERLRHMHDLKTGALLRASVLLGGACAQATPDELRGLGQWGQALGYAFQVVDDILDATASTEVLGKTAGKDQAADKPTVVTQLGLPAARELAQSLQRQAHEALQTLSLPEGHHLATLTDWVVNRIN